MFITANKSDLILAAAMPVDMSTASAVTTSDVVRRLGSVAQSTYLRARLCVLAPDLDATGRVNLNVSGTNVAEQEMGSPGYFEKEIDLANVAGAAELQVSYECLTTGTDHKITVWVEIEQPSIIGV
jgi:hypothetical protein